ncbi:MAG: hypothetical protein P3T54_01940 [Dehalogenimonas sp.]|jgi:hypothetical protein|uniref:Uncharacterized protein n=1 Tax=Candidatus Dehalogenimonas loeffleri TaxID=3127115 RepID=A0ABZ2J5A8_9CHLR|nr:hypothetical protein [Dehalogenimonas sp.]
MTRKSLVLVAVSLLAVLSACGDSQNPATQPPATTSVNFDVAAVAAQYIPAEILAAGELSPTSVNINPITPRHFKFTLTEPVTLAQMGLEDNPLVDDRSTGELPAGQFVQFTFKVQAETNELLEVTATDKVIPDITFGPFPPPPPSVNPIMLIAAFTAGISLAGLLFTWFRRRRRTG